MHPDYPQIHMSVNHFELTNPWGQPVDKSWALKQFSLWLDNRLDLAESSVYDAAIPAEGDHHAI